MCSAVKNSVRVSSGRSSLKVVTACARPIERRKSISPVRVRMAASL
jgi:hypothetical protein